ncbi:MAG: mechanosensitive ion channel [Muribaculaceae bacterium]|uniref:mechanosensitive ion channel family protein n=1 Tax=uncultured Duncaniella sp. TaxID=2768039 RepID=UPI001A358840|nr:mechanosensitive ion channel domain-containing protein [uncultured Duncaniella sp.]MBJ2190326.1 mechanosensitive ion channel [Muribaculaceae bacterium]
MLLSALIPSNRVAQWLLVHIHHLLDAVGLKKNQTIEEVIYAAIIVCIALFIGWAIRNIVLYGVRKFMLMRHSTVGKELIDHKVLSRCSHIIPPLVLLALLPFAFTSETALRVIVLRGLLIYTVVVVCRAICTVTKFIWLRFDETRNSKNLPLGGILDTAVGIIWFIAVIICISIVVNKSPVNLLTGLGAFAAVLMLVFKDSILGLVAGLQLSQNDMLRVGDWIVVPSTIANGIVIDVNLTAVKVQNWDNTIVTLPPYTLVSTSFQNWRGMTESGCRQIARSVIIDSDTIVPATKEMISEITGKYPIIKTYIDKIDSLGHNDYNPGLAVVNGTNQTNLGLFRAYMCQWLLNNPAIRSDEQILVRLMPPTGEGIPLQIWCFTATTNFTAYEAIQSAVFEHVAVTAIDFGLRLFNDPSGTDVTTVTLTPPASAQTNNPAPNAAAGSAS